MLKTILKYIEHGHVLILTIGGAKFYVTLNDESKLCDVYKDLEALIAGLAVETKYPDEYILQELKAKLGYI